MMKRTSIAGLLVLMASGVWAHDMFLVLAEHSLDPNSPVSVSLYNGTFDKSENAIARDRMLDVSVVNGAARVSHPATDQWRDEGQVAILEFETGEPGTYVVGVSTAANMIELTAEEFDDYLKHDGVLDVLEARHHEGDLTEPVRERYSKHVKTILQVGDAVTDSQSFKPRSMWAIRWNAWCSRMAILWRINWSMPATRDSTGTAKKELIERPSIPVPTRTAW